MVLATISVDVSSQVVFFLQVCCGCLYRRHASYMHPATQFWQEVVFVFLLGEDCSRKCFRVWGPKPVKRGKALPQLTTGASR